MDGYRTQSDDVDPRVERQNFELGRELTPVDRLRIAVRACQAQHRLQVAGLRLRYPDESEEQLARRAGALRLGRELCLRSFGPQALEWLE